MCLWGRWNTSIKTKVVLFLIRVSLIINSLNVGISGFKFVFLRYTKCWLYIFIFFREFLSFECHISGFCVCHHCYRHGVLQCTTVTEMFVIFLVVEILIYNKKFLVSAHWFGFPFPKLGTFSGIFWVLPIDYSLYKRKKTIPRIFVYLFIYKVTTIKVNSRFYSQCSQAATCLICKRAIFPRNANIVFWL